MCAASTGVFFYNGWASTASDAFTLLEALATPDHSALGPGQRGVNERDDVFDLHGGTSHLAPHELRDLIEYLLTIE